MNHIFIGYVVWKDYSGRSMEVVLRELIEEAIPIILICNYDNFA